MTQLFIVLKELYHLSLCRLLRQSQDEFLTFMLFLLLEQSGPFFIVVSSIFAHFPLIPLHLATLLLLTFLAAASKSQEGSKQGPSPLSQIGKLSWEYRPTLVKKLQRKTPRSRWSHRYIFLLIFPLPAVIKRIFAGMVCFK